MGETKTSPESSPTRAAESIVRKAFEELEAMRYGNVAALVHPDILPRFRSVRLEEARQMERNLSIEATMRGDPGVPQAVADWHEQQRRKFETEHGSWIDNEFAGVTSITDLEALTAVEMLARWLQARDPREHARRQIQAKGQELPAEMRSEDLPGERRQVAGSFLEDDSTVQVVYRTQPSADPQEDAEHSRLAVATVRRAPEGWRLWSMWQDRHLFDTLNLSVWIETVEERLQKAEEEKDRRFAWPQSGTPIVRAAIKGYEGGGKRPSALSLAVRDASGQVRQIDVPIDALGSLCDYVEPWLFLPEPP